MEKKRKKRGWGGVGGGGGGKADPPKFADVLYYSIRLALFLCVDVLCV